MIAPPPPAPSRAASLLRRPGVLPWCLYDAANSAFVTSVITVVMPVYFLTLTPHGAGPVSVGLGPLGFDTNGDALFAYVTATYQFAVVLAAPWLGALADQIHGRRGLLGISVLLGCGLTAGLAAVAPGQYGLCAVLFIGAAFAWNCGNLFYDALLPDLARDAREIDAISSAGYAIGYLGGGLLLALNLAMVQSPRLFGLPDKAVATQAVFVSVAVWWLLLALPVLGTRAASSPVPTTTTPAAPASLWKACTAAVRQLRSTFSQIRQHKAAFAVLLAYMFYNTGVGAVITIATLFGKAELNLPTGTLVGCVLMIQFIGVPAALAFIRLGAWIGTRGAILSGLGVYALTLLLAFRMTTAAEFWLLGVLVGLVQGGTQALSRSLYGRLIPTERSAEFFGFFSVFSKVGGFAGPLLYGLVRDATGSSRLGVLSLLVFFVAGGLVLWAAPLGRAQDSPGSGKAGGG